MCSKHPSLLASVQNAQHIKLEDFLNLLFSLPDSFFPEIPPSFTLSALCSNVNSEVFPDYHI